VLKPGKVHKIGVRLCALLVRLRLNLDSTAELHENLAKQRLVLHSMSLLNLIPEALQS